MNKEISEKSGNVTELTQIVFNLKKENYDQLENERIRYGDSNFEDFSLETIELKSQVLSVENTNLFKITMEKHKILKNFCAFMMDYDKQIMKLLQKMMDIKKIKLHNKKIQITQMEENLITVYNTDQNTSTINHIKDWNSSESKKIIEFS